MPWTVEYDPEHGIVTGTYVGRVTDEEFRQATVEAMRLATAHATNLFLIDDSKWEGGASTLGLFDLPALFSELGFARDSRGAVILPPAGTPQAEDVEFFETVCVNRGWYIRLFKDRATALGWLVGDADGPEAS